MLTHDKMYITYENYQKKKVNVKYSKDMYKLFTWSGISLKLNDVFKFSTEVIKNSSVIFSRKDNNYITIHIRLGDSNLEINKTYIMCKNDNRICDNEKLYKYIENNKHETILITSDNKDFKLHIKDKYDNVVVTKCNIGHIGLKNTTLIQVLDTLTELYIMSLSKKIITVLPFLLNFSLNIFQFIFTSLFLGKNYFPGSGSPSSLSASDGSTISPSIVFKQ